MFECERQESAVKIAEFLKLAIERLVRSPDPVVLKNFVGHRHGEQDERNHRRKCQQRVHRIIVIFLRETGESVGKVFMND